MKAKVKWKDLVKTIDETQNSVFKYNILTIFIVKLLKQYKYLYILYRRTEASVHYEASVYFFQKKKKFHFHKLTQ